MTTSTRTTADIVAHLVADVLGHDATAVTQDMLLEGDTLACDQLERLEIAIRLEDTFAVAISDDDLYACDTVADLGSMLARLGVPS